MKGAISIKMRHWIWQKQQQGFISGLENVLMKILYRIILVLGFGAIFAAIALVWAAQARFEQAKALEKVYRWQAAEKQYESAIRINPFNSEYLGGYADFLYRINYSRKNKLYCFKKAEILYKKAIAFNPENADYYTGLGKIYAAM